MDVISLSDSNVDASVASLKASNDRQKQNVHKTKRSHKTPKSEVEVLTLSSTESSECSRQSRRKFTHKSRLSLLNKETFCSPSPKSKVSVWLYKNSIEDFISVPEEPSLIDSDLHMSSFDDCSVLSATKPSILVRQDYDKITAENKPIIKNKKSTKVRAQSGSTCLESGSESSITFHKRTKETKSSQSNTPPSVRNLHHLLKSMTNLCNEELPTNDTKKNYKASSEIPISPESQKKNELCEYLKLMNMNSKDKSIINMRQKRRSTRVQHLAIMTGKKELEKKLSREMMEKNIPLSRHKRALSIDKSSKSSSKVRKNSTESSVATKEIIQKKKLFSRTKIKSNHFTSKTVLTALKSLQVPEISTTSITNKKSNEFLKLLTENNSNLKNTEVFSKGTNEIFNGKHKNGSQFNFNFSLPKVYKVETDFEESIKHALGNNLKHKLDLILKNENAKRVLSSKKKVPKSSVKLRKIQKRNLQKESSVRTNNSKENVRRITQKYRRVVQTQHLNKLRSRGRLKRVHFKTLLNQAEKKGVHKKAKQKHKPNVDEELIKTSQTVANKVKELNVDSVSLATKSIDLKYFETKVNEINSELKYVDELTPEHLQALVESQKFLSLDMESKSSLKITSHETLVHSEENSSTNCELPKQIGSKESFHTDVDVITSEDLEVDALMNRSKTKHRKRRQSVDNETEGDLLGEVEQDGASKDDSRCTSLSIHSTCSNCSVGSVHNDSLNLPSTSKDNIIEIDLLTDEDEKNPLVEISSSTHEMEVKSTFNPEIVNIAQIEPSNCNYINPSSEVEVKSLHHYLLLPPKKEDKCRSNSPSSQKNWDEHLKYNKLPKGDKKCLPSHTILLSDNNGPVRNAYYLDHNLIVVQDLLISFWNQTPLGNILGAQDMWIPRGNVKRIVLSNGCVPIESSEMVTSVSNSVAYGELWIKEHKSDKRERPVADIFVVIYFTSRCLPDKKVLQLENIHGLANDVHYVILRNSYSIVVSWNVLEESDACTTVHSYELSADYKTVTSIKKMQSIGHYVSSLHNIQDCDHLIMACGNGKLTLCDIEYGCVVATIDLNQMLPQPCIRWAKCDRGFLFTLHEFTDGSLHLMAVNSFDSTWKKLQSYKPIAGYNNLLGACVENGILVAFYANGVLCWYAQSSDLIIEDAVEDTVFMPFGKYVTVIVNNQVHVRHALAYLVCED